MFITFFKKAVRARKNKSRIFFIVKRKVKGCLLFENRAIILHKHAEAKKETQHISH
jgi:hypothetical protein